MLTLLNPEVSAKIQETSIIHPAAVAHRRATEVPSFSYETGSVLSPKLVLVLAIAVLVVGSIATAITYRGGLNWDHNVAVQSLRSIF